MAHILPGAIMLLLAGACPQNQASQAAGQIGEPVSAVRPANIYLKLTKDGQLEENIAGEVGVAGSTAGPDDPVRIASISKMVTAIGVMRLAEEGKVDLDRDVGEYLGWPLRNPSYPQKAITLRMLLSHTSGLRDEAGYFLPIDGKLQELLRNPKAWDSAHPPDSYFSYANLGSPIIAAVMEGASGERFDRLMQRLVMQPLKLDACFNWSGCSAGRRAQAISLLRPNGEIAKDPPISQNMDVCDLVPASDGSCNPENYILAQNGSSFSPQGGLRISANDLLVIGKMLSKNDGSFLSQKSVSEMLRPHWRYNGSNGDDMDGAFYAYGLGIDIQPGGWFGHVGDAYGLRAGLWINRGSGEIRVRYVTMVDENIPVGSCLDQCP